MRGRGGVIGVRVLRGGGYVGGWVCRRTDRLGRVEGVRELGG